MAWGGYKMKDWNLIFGIVLLGGGLIFLIGSILDYARWKLSKAGLVVLGCLGITSISWGMYFLKEVLEMNFGMGIVVGVTIGFLSNFIKWAYYKLRKQEALMVTVERRSLTEDSPIRLALAILQNTNLIKKLYLSGDDSGSHVWEMKRTALYKEGIILYPKEETLEAYEVEEENVIEWNKITEDERGALEERLRYPDDEIPIIDPSDTVLAIGSIPTNDDDQCPNVEDTSTEVEDTQTDSSPDSSNDSNRNE